MTDSKSKIPGLKEVGSMCMKLLTDLKKSVCEIVETYKTEHQEPGAGESPSAETQTQTKSKTGTEGETATSEETASSKSDKNV